MTMELTKVISDILGRDPQIQDSTPLDLHMTVTGVRRLPSKKNAVHLIMTKGGGVVLKVHEEGRAEWEHVMLTRCVNSGVHVPRPLLLGPNFIVMEYLEGPNLCDVLNLTLDMTYLTKIADWFVDFHLSFHEEGETMVKSDAKLQNLLLTQKGVAGLDFELAHRGDFKEDLGELCAHILDTDPMFIPLKYRMCDALLIRYKERTGWELSGLTQWLTVALREAARFRPHQSQLLLNLCNKLEEGEVWPFSFHDPQNK